jgi:hypothetical protein
MMDPVPLSVWENRLSIAWTSFPLSEASAGGQVSHEQAESLHGEASEISADLAQRARQPRTADGAVNRSR